MPDPLLEAFKSRAARRSQRSSDPLLDAFRKRASEVGYLADGSERESTGIVAGLKDVGTAIRHPIQTVRGMGDAISDGFNKASSPIEGMPKNIIGNFVRGRSQERVTQENTPNAVTPREFGKGAFESALNIGFAVAPALGLAARTATNAGLGALHSPDDRLRGATSGLVLGEVLHGATKLPGKIARASDVSEGMVQAGASSLETRFKARALERAETPELAPVVEAKPVPDIIPDETPRIPVTEAEKRIAAAVEAEKARQVRAAEVRGRWAPEGSLRNKDGDLIKDLTNVPDEVLEAELIKIRETNAAEEMAAESVRAAGYRDAYEELPRTERLGRKGQEDLPDADGMIDAERLADDNKILAEYNKNTIVRQARDRAAQRLEAELAARQPQKYRRIEDEPEPVQKVVDEAPEVVEDFDTSFDFGANVFKPEAPSDILNVAKLNLSDLTAEQRVVAQLEKHRAFRDSNRQTFEQADINIAEIYDELLAGDRKALNPQAAKRLSGEELLARRDVVSQNDALISELSKAIESKTLSVADNEQAAVLLQNALDHNDALLSDLVAGSSQKGRDLNLLRRIANRDLDPATWQIQAKRMLGDRPLSDEIAATIRKLANEAAEACQ